MQGEQAIYQDTHGVWISSARAVFANQTYAVAQISAVSTHTTDPNRAGPILVILLGALLYFVSWVLTLLFVVLGFVLLALQKPMYSIWITTSGGNVQAWRSQNRDYIQAVHGALQQAIISRG